MEELSEPLLLSKQRQRINNDKKHTGDGPEIVDLDVASNNDDDDDDDGDIPKNNMSKVEEYTVCNKNNDDGTIADRTSSSSSQGDLFSWNFLWRAVVLFQFVWPPSVFGLLELFRVYSDDAAFNCAFLGNAVALTLWYRYLRENNGEKFLGFQFVCYDCAPTIFWFSSLLCFDILFPWGFVVFESFIWWFLVYLVQWGPMEVAKSIGTVCSTPLSRICPGYAALRNMEEGYYTEMAAREEQEQQELEAQQERLKYLESTTTGASNASSKRWSVHHWFVAITIGLAVLSLFFLFSDREGGGRNSTLFVPQTIIFKKS